MDGKIHVNGNPKKQETKHTTREKISSPEEDRNNMKKEEKTRKQITKWQE